MGKHERKLIEEAEKIIVKILNCQKIDASDRDNFWFNHALSIAERIKKDFQNIAGAKHLGNRYDNTGDILLDWQNKNIFIEVKMSATKSGVGTKANISQNALTENHLFEGNVNSWSKFRQDKKHNKWINDYLNSFAGYPGKVSNITSPALKTEEKARYLRKLSKKGNRKARQILGSISQKDRQEKMEYLSYLSKKKQRGKMIKNFLALIILGIHRKEELKNLIEKQGFFREAQNLFVYYGNLDRNKIIVRRENMGNRVKNIFESYSTFEIIFPEKTTHCKIMGLRNRTRESLLQIVFHWKNIAQGIKTPCLNIFDLSARDRPKSI